MDYLNYTEKELVARAVQGDQMAFRALYQIRTMWAPRAARGRLRP